jgi:hypothetical protein
MSATTTRTDQRKIEQYPNNSSTGTMQTLTSIKSRQEIQSAFNLKRYDVGILSMLGKDFE